MSRIKVRYLFKEFQKLVVSLFDLFTGNVWTIYGLAILLLILGLTFIYAPVVDQNGNELMKDSSMLTIGWALLVVSMILVARSLLKNWKRK